jgi:hypothetical protein
VNELRDKARFKSALSEIFEAFEARTASSSPPDFIGAAYREPLEHTTRRFVIDEILDGLGWNLGRMTREMVEEARAQGDTTLFLDYLGVNPELRVPLLIVEGKAWGKPFVTESDAAAAEEVLANRSPPEALLAKAIQHCKQGGRPERSPLILEWAKWIHKLHQYVTTVHRQSGHIVQQLAITSGRWWVIFTRPYETFVATGPVSTANILVFEGPEVIERSDNIFDHLARQKLIRDPPNLIQPSQLSAYVDRGGIARLYHALWVVRRKDGAHFDAFPQINLYPSIVLERRDGQLLAVIDHYRQRITIPHRYDALPAHIDEVEQNAAALLQTVRAEADVALAPSPLTTFPGFPITGGLLGRAGLQQIIRFLKSSATPDEFLLVTGSNSHFLLPQPRIHPCAGHTWSECHSLHENQLNAPIVSRSYDPASFFTTMEPHHCTHRTVHNRRASRCHVGHSKSFSVVALVSFKRLVGRLTRPLACRAELSSRADQVHPPWRHRQFPLRPIRRYGRGAVRFSFQLAASTFLKWVPNRIFSSSGPKRERMHRSAIRYSVKPARN